MLEYYHLPVMTLCGFVKGEGLSLCHSVCKNRKERRGRNITPGKLHIKCRVNPEGHWDVGEIPPSLKEKKKNLR
jgi:hypothetical protein